MSKEPESWEISIGNWGGYAPSYFDNSYSFYGNKNQATTTTDVDIRDPNVLTQGPNSVALTSGNEAGELGEELIIAILKHATATDTTYAVSNDKVFQLTSTAVANSNFPKTIAVGTANVATDLLQYKGKTLVFWNDTGVDGDIGLLTNATTWDDNWGSTVATGAAQLADAPHYGIVGGDDVAYITNGIYIATVNNVTLNATALDFHSDAKTISVTWNWNKVVIAVNRPNITGSNMNLSMIVNWNGVSSSWEGDPIEVNGEIGALYTKNGITYCWWKDGITTGGYSFGYINSGRLETIRRYAGSLPNQAQVGDYDGFIGWISSNKLVLWGSKDKDVPVNFFRFMSGEYGTVGTWAAPFGTPLISSEKSADFTAATNDVITCATHGLSNTDTVRLTTTTTLPAGLSAATTYYVVSATTSTFKLSLTSGGDPIDITGTGTGTHTWHRYSIAKASGYSVGARYNTMAYPMRSPGWKCQIDLIQLGFETLASGAKVDTTITYNQGASTLALDQIAYSASDTSTFKKIYNGGLQCDDFRIDFSWANGSTSNPVKIRTLLMKGTWIQNN